AGTRAVREQRIERRAAAGVARVLQAVFRLELEAVRVYLPAGRRMRLGQESERSPKSLQAPLELPASPRCVCAGHAVLPPHVIKGMKPHFETGIVHAEHLGAGFAADVRAR